MEKKKKIKPEKKVLKSKTYSLVFDVFIIIRANSERCTYKR